MAGTDRRATVLWAALEDILDEFPGATVLDIGGGTGGFAVRLAEQGHRVRVIDPSPDALAALGRRAGDAGVADLVSGEQGDLADLAALVPTGSVDVVLCHGVIEMVPDPAAALASIAAVLRPGGVLSLLVAQRHAAVIARAMAGQFQQARDLLVGGPGAVPSSARSAGRRFTAAEVEELLKGAGFTPSARQAIRVFSDLVPGALHDNEPGSAEALADLERAVSSLPEFLPLASQVHLVARR
ncbi:class I SAM-dependent methyltransferase [Nocardioides jiangxiensis]|uniref:Methyltransferase domain-containing protein n=1 Tax=Nocardioides jiangxiensis TaxID=3064524 RepID=A0ABT9B3N4_9ACTN|nr:methyltransferase domain-containing protein [Nocardioides sp. WY-20]MDO7869332.1 methyltransferase domain-containing protein [Nocardioides sp. WY-20]